MNKTYLSCLLFPLLLIVFSAESVLAHKVTVFAWAEGDMIHTQSKFSGGRKVKGGEIIVSDLHGNPFLRGKTDDQGEFSFRIPKKTGLKIEIVGGMGHRGEWTIPLEEILEASGEESLFEANPAQTPEKPSFELPKPQTPPSAPTPRPESELTREEVRAIVENALDKKLKPLTNMLADSLQQSPGISDIMGGIGYILGLVGLAAYVNSRKKK